MNREELAWAAGFFDGEGYVACNSQGHLAMTIGQCHPEVLERFRDALGMGKVYGPYAPKQSHQSLYWRYDLNHNWVQQAICLLWPWLSSVKKAQCSQAMLDWRAIPRKPRSKLSKHVIEEIVARYLAGEHPESICQDYDIHKTSVVRIVRRHHPEVTLSRRGTGRWCEYARKESRT